MAAGTPAMRRPAALAPEPELPVGWPEPPPVATREVAVPPVTRRSGARSVRRDRLSRRRASPGGGAARSPIPRRTRSSRTPAPVQTGRARSSRAGSSTAPLPPPPRRSSRLKAASPRPSQSRCRKPPSAPAAKLSAASEGTQRSVAHATKEHNQLVGLKIGASQIAAAYVLNKGGPRRSCAWRASPLERGVVVGGELREPEQLAAALKAFFRKNKLPQNCVRLGDREQPDRRPHVRDHRDRRPEAARERRPLPRPGDAADPARRGSARLPDPRRPRRRGRRPRTAACCSSSPTGSSSSATSPPAERPG